MGGVFVYTISYEEVIGSLRANPNSQVIFYAHP